ncbi:hypothetical protein [Breoghania sp. L-A4]|uniref:hypothetical protein n=1 Tax=Breoghania sp. L-A4 TaxID=2304600 RepID=UPI000E35C2F7|nr:hypothetical protein [Breoghania sp. L-A4]AXS39758.1 hypothetical protein D1F64_06450 [Breoghania sp. L-A4]
MAQFDDFSGPNGQPTEAERRLIAATQAGEWAECQDIAEKAEKTVSPALIRALATGVFEHKDSSGWALAPDGIQLFGATIPERLGLANLRIPASLKFITCAFPEGVDLSDTTIQGAVFFRKCAIDGEFDINSADIAGQFSVNNTTFHNDGGRAVWAQGVKATVWFMDNAEVTGEFTIPGAEITGQFSADNAKFSNAGGNAIFAQDVKAADLLMRNAKIEGDVLLNHAHIHSMLDLSGTSFTASRHRALTLSDAEVQGPANCENACFLGHIHASRAHFHGQVSFRGAQLVAATQARKAGDLQARLAETVSDSDRTRQNRFRHHALVLREAVFEGRLIMPETCPEGIVDLGRARCDTLEDVASGWPPMLVAGQDTCDQRLCIIEDGMPIDIQHLVLDGFECKHFEHPDGTDRPVGDGAGPARIVWLAGQSADDLKTHFNPQPWRMTSAVLRAMGYEKAADKVSVTRRTRQRLSNGTPRRTRLLGWLLHRTADYGYNPLKAVVWSTGIVVIFALLFAGGNALCENARCGARDAFLQARHGDINEGAYPAFQPLLYSLDLFVPILDFNSESFWRADTDAKIPLEKPYLKLGFGPLFVAQSIPVGWLLHLLAIAERVIGAIMVAIAIVGFTGLVKREEK